jgi:hypothetical protein
LQAQIAAGAYRVDAQAVAEALLRRLLEGRTPEPGGDDRS